MTVRILSEENQELKELAEEYPHEASIIEAMLKDAESQSDDDMDEQKHEDA